MSTPDPAVAADATPARRKRPAKLLLFAVPVLLLGGGGAYAYVAGIGPFARSPNGTALPTPILEPGSTPEHPRYKTSYLKIDGAFTTNLAGSGHFVQVEIGVATVYDAAILAKLQTHELPIRSAVLGVLAQQSEEAVSSPSGRAALQRQLKTTINRVLIDKEGFGGVSDVYLTGLVVQ